MSATALADGAAGASAVPAGKTASIATLVRFRQLLLSPLYNLLPESAKVVVFDLDIPMSIVFYALVEHDLFAAAVWNSFSATVVGVVSPFDFARLMRRFHITATHDAGRAMSNNTIASWTMMNPPHPTPMPSPDDTFRDFCRQLVDHNTVPSLLPVVDPEQSVVLSMLGFTPVLRYVMFHLTEDERTSLFSQSVADMKLGRFEGIITLNSNSLLIEAITIIADHAISAIPILNDDGVLVDIYSSSDITFLARDANLDSLDRSIADVRKLQFETCGGSVALPVCSKHDSILHVIGLFLTGNLSRLICVDSHNRVEGIVSWRDIARLFLSICDSAPDPAPAAEPADSSMGLVLDGSSVE